MTTTRNLAVFCAISCAIFLIVSVASAQTTATITVSGVVKETTHVKKPVALFDARPDFGMAPLKVSFTDKSLHNPTTYFWSFGDGTMSTLKNPPVHLYARPGVYRVLLTVSNSAGRDSVVRFVYTLPRWWYGWDWK